MIIDAREKKQERRRERERKREREIDPIIKTSSNSCVIINTPELSTKVAARKEFKVIDQICFHSSIGLSLVPVPPACWSILASV